MCLIHIAFSLSLVLLPAPLPCPRPSPPSLSPGRGLRVVWLTENPKCSGNSLNSRLISVPLPTPDGPQITRGRRILSCETTADTAAGLRAHVQHKVMPVGWTIAQNTTPPPVLPRAAHLGDVVLGGKMTTGECIYVLRDKHAMDTAPQHIRDLILLPLRLSARSHAPRAWRRAPRS